MRTATTYYRLALAVTVATAFFLVLAIGALGIIGAGGRPDRIYVAVLAVLVAGTVVARLRPAGMALVLVATAFAQVLVTAAAFLAGLPQERGASVVDIVGINAMYTVLFGLSAWLFRQAAGQTSPVGVSSRA